MFKKASVSIPAAGISLEGDPGLGMLTITDKIQADLHLDDGSRLIINLPENLKTDMSSIPMTGVMATCAAMSTYMAVNLEEPNSRLLILGVWGAAILVVRFRPRRLFPAGVVHDALYGGTYEAYILQGGRRQYVRLSRRTCDLVYRRLILDNVSNSNTTAVGRRISADGYYVALRVGAGSHYNKKANIPHGEEVLL